MSITGIGNSTISAVQSATPTQTTKTRSNAHQSNRGPRCHDRICYGHRARTSSNPPLDLYSLDIQLRFQRPVDAN
jgi:hypothetical protein